MEHAKRYSKCEGVIERQAPMGRVLRRKTDQVMKITEKRKSQNNQYKFGKLADLWRIYKVDFGRNHGFEERQS